MHKLEPFADDAPFRTEWRKVKNKRKQELAAYRVAEEPGGKLPGS